MPKEILDVDIISRSIIEPTHIDQFGKLKIDTFQFSKNRPESVNCHRLFPDGINAHQLGKDLEQVQQQNQLEQEKKPNKVYRGYIESEAQKIQNVKVDKIYFQIFHRRTDSNYAHCEIEIKTTDNSNPKASGQKTLAREKLKDVFSKLIPYLVIV